MKSVLVTGAAGFIGAWTVKALLDRGDRVVGVDNFNPYYDVKLKRDRAEALTKGCRIHEVDLADRAALARVLDGHAFDQVCHLGAQAGVRHSIQNPHAYESANNLGTLNVFEEARGRGIPSVILASSSSVYGGNTKIPFSVEDPVDRPISFYAATKRANELTAHVYHHLFGIRCTALRFFTVYGPWGRPDMALFTFTRRILAGEPIDVYNHGNMRRDFTYIKDIVSGILAALDRDYPFEILNLGNSTPVDLARLIELLEAALGKKARKNPLPIQPGDVPATWADIKKSTDLLGFHPKTGIEEGVRRFVEWYREYYR